MKWYFFVYAMSDKASFEAIEFWLKTVRQFSEGAEINGALVANKADLLSKIEVSSQKGREFAEKNLLQFYEVSALENKENCVDNMFEEVIEKAFAEHGAKVGLYIKPEPKATDYKKNPLTVEDGSKGCC